MRRNILLFLQFFEQVRRGFYPALKYHANEALSGNYPAPNPKLAQTPQPVAVVITVVSAAKVTTAINTSSLKLFLFLVLITVILSGAPTVGAPAEPASLAVINEQCLCHKPG